MEFARYLIAAGFISLAAWRIVRMRAFVDEDVAWLRERFAEDESDVRTARTHSMIVAAFYAAAGLVLAFG